MYSTKQMVYNFFYSEAIWLSWSKRPEIVFHPFFGNHSADTSPKIGNHKVYYPLWMNIGVNFPKRSYRLKITVIYTSGTILFEVASFIN